MLRVIMRNIAVLTIVSFVALWCGFSLAGRNRQVNSVVPAPLGHLESWLDQTAVGTSLTEQKTPKLLALSKSRRRILAVILGGGSCCGVAGTGVNFLRGTKNPDVVVLYAGNPSVVETVRQAYGLREETSVMMVGAEELTRLGRRWAPSILVVENSRVTWKQGQEGELP